MPRSTSTASADAPVYDPGVHTDPDTVVHAQLFCMCGGVHRQLDPVRFTEPFVRSWLDKHRGDGHGPATIAEAIEEREVRKQAALRVAGRGHEYQRKTYETLDPTCTASRPWPVFSDQQEG